MALETLTLENFQAHKKLTVAFAAGITAIVGSSDVGKSATIRALRWAMQNTPDGLEFVRHGEKEAVVTVEIDGRSLVRSRGKSENFYGLEGDEFKAFGKGVPTEIADFLRVADINFQSQHDAPFWFSLSPPEVSRQLNQIINLSAIDEVLSTLESQKRSASSQVAVLEQRVSEAKRTQESLEFVEGFTNALLDLEEMESYISKKRQQVESLESVLNRTLEEQSNHERLERLAEQGSHLVELADAMRSARKRAGELEEVIDDIREHNAARKLLPPDFAPVTAALESVQALETKHSALNSHIEYLRELYREHKKKTDKAAAAEAELKEKTGGRCPVCGGEL